MKKYEEPTIEMIELVVDEDILDPSLSGGGLTPNPFETQES